MVEIIENMTTTRKVDQARYAALVRGLDHFSGSENFYRCALHRSLIYTEGVRFMAEKGGAYWLIDAIASHQPEALKNEQLHEFQVWRLKVNPDSTAVLYCCEDDERLDKAKIRQDIEYTDFPLDEIKLYVGQSDQRLWTLMLPGEY